jgi:hypothetical protein
MSDHSAMDLDFFSGVACDWYEENGSQGARGWVLWSDASTEQVTAEDLARKALSSTRLASRRRR